MADVELSPEMLRRMDAYWRAANFLSVGQIYLYDNPLLKRALTPNDVKHMLLGHWGTTPGQNFIYMHLNRIIKQYDLEYDLCVRPGAWRPRGRRQHLSWRVRTARFIRTSRRTRRDCASCSSSFPFQGAFPAMRHPNARVPFTRAANSVIRSATLLERCWTTRLGGGLRSGRW